MSTESTGKKAHIWRQEINVFNNKLTLETSGTHKRWMIKIWDSYKYYKFIRPQVIATKSPFILKLFIFGEISVWAYSNFIRGKYENIQNYLDQYVVENPIYQLIKKDNTVDYLANIMVYSYLGKFMYVKNKFSFYSIFFLGSALSFPLLKVKDYISCYFDKNLNIEEFQLFNPTNNLIPKMILSLSVMQYLNYFLSDSRFVIKEGLTIDKKAITLFLWIYTFSKLTQYFSNYTTESIK
jgi:hypothetical protein